MSARVYLDWNATSPLRAEARDAMIAAMDVSGNPSSVHAEGRAAKALVENARAEVAEAVGCAPDEVIFTASATEALQHLRRVRGVSWVKTQSTGHGALTSQATEVGNGTGLYGMGLANAETGEIYDIPEKGPVGFDAGDGVTAQVLALDATQAIGRIPFAFNWSGADIAVLAAHKLGGPKGVGALILRKGIDVDPLLLGGGQEMGRRASTENLIGIAGFGAAAQAAAKDLANGMMEQIAQMRDAFEEVILSGGDESVIVARDKKRLANTSCIITPGWKGETQVMRMDLEGFAISAGSACSSGKVKPSSVLLAMGYDDVHAASAIRVSIGRETDRDDLMKFADVWLSTRDRHLRKVA